MLQLASGMSRLGTETAFGVLARAQAIAATGRSVVSLGIGQPDFSTPPHIVEAACKALRDGHHGYTHSNGIPQLREAVSADLKRRLNVEVDPGRIICVPGGKVTMFFAILMFGEPGAEIVYPDPGFPIYRSVIDFTGAKAVPLHLKEQDGFGFKAEDVLSLITPRTRLIIINSPANPTGGVTSGEETEKLVKGLEKHPNVAIMSDEIYGQMLYDGRKHHSLLNFESLRDRLILLDGWSKTYAMTGWRLGYAVWPQALVESATKLAVNCHSCVSTASQFAGIAALEGPQDSLAVMMKAFAERRRYLVDALNRIPGVRCVEPGGAFYAFPNIGGTGLTSKQTEVGLLEDAGLATVAGTSFGQFGEGFLRLSYANSLDNIKEAVRRMQGWLETRAKAA